MADDLNNTLLFACVFASTVWFWRNNPGTPPVFGGGVCGLVVSWSYGGHSVEETPGSIPNPVAKRGCGDGTALGRVWESRSPPDIFVWGVGESLKGPWGFFASPAPPFLCPEPEPLRLDGSEDTAHLAVDRGGGWVVSPAVRRSGVAPISARTSRRGRGWRLQVDSG